MGAISLESRALSSTLGVVMAPEFVYETLGSKGILLLKKPCIWPIESQILWEQWPLPNSVVKASRAFYGSLQMRHDWQHSCQT